MGSSAGFTTKPIREVDVPEPEPAEWPETVPAEPEPIEEPAPA